MCRSLLGVFLCMLCAFAAAADQVTLKNGDRISGTIVSGDAKTLQLKSEFAGDVSIKWEAITAIESSQDLTVTLADGKRLGGKLTTKDGAFVVAAGGPGEATVPKANVVAIRNTAEQRSFDEQAERTTHPKFTYFWSGVFDTGLALTRGNSATASYTLNANAVRETPRDKLTLYGTYIYASDDTTPPARTTANAIRSGIRGDLNVGPRFFVFALADFETNQLQHLDLREVYGGGFGYHALKTARNTFDIFGGISYDRDNFGAYSLPNPTPPPPTTPVASRTQDSGEAVVGEEFDSKLAKRTTLTERFSIYPNLTHTGDYRMQFDSTVATQLKNWLSCQFTFSDRFINYPPPGLKGDDLLLSMGLRVTWGKPAHK